MRTRVCVYVRAYACVRVCVRENHFKPNRHFEPNRLDTPAAHVPRTEPRAAGIPPSEAVSGSEIPVPLEGNFQNRSEGL